MNLSKVALVALSMISLSLTGCLGDLSEDENKNYQISVNGYIVQENNGNTKTFTPYLYVTTTTSDYDIDTLSYFNKSSDEKNFKFSKYNDYLYYTDGEYKATNIKDLNGTYYFEATSSLKNYTTSTLSIDLAESDTIAAVVLTDFSYDGSYVKATIKEIDNIDAIGISVAAYNKDNKPLRLTTSYLYKYTSPIYFTNGELNLSYQLSTNASYMDVDYAEVKVFVKNEKCIQRESIAKTLERGVNHFLEDEVEEK